MKTRNIIQFLALLFSFLAVQAKADVVKTVGATGADFARLQLAFNAINNNTGGVYTGAVTLQIIDNTIETGNVTLNASANWSSLKIYPTATGKTISGNINGAHLYIFASNVTIDGRLHQFKGTLIGSTRDLTITNSMVGSSAYTFRFEGNASHNNVKYCTIKGSSNVNYRGTIGFQSSSALNGNGYNVVSNNLITTADPANRPVYSIYSVGSTGFANNYNQIKDNEFVDFISPVLGGSAISIGTENNGWTISGNSFYEQNPGTSIAASNYNIISVNNTSGTGFIVTDNYIGGSAVNCGGSAWTKSNEGNNAFTGINLNVGGTPATSVQNNTIQNINWSNSGAAAWTGISFTGSAVDMGTTTGNIIGSPTGTGSITFIAGATQAIFTAINLTNKSISGYCSNNKIGSITATSTTGYVTVYGIFNNLSTGTTQINNNIIGSLETANSISAGAVSTGQLVYGIRSNSTGTTTYIGNSITNITNNGTTGTTACINTASGTNTVDGNFIYNIMNPNSTSANSVTLQGIYIGASAASATYTYSNNILKLGSDVPTVIYGIMEENTTATGTTKINFNTIYLTGNQTTGSTTSSFCFRTTNTSANARDIRNNIFVSGRSTTGGSALHYVFYSGVTPSANAITCDYNDYFHSGTGGILARYISSYPGNLPIVTSQIGNDANSKKLDPVFANAGGINAVDYKPSYSINLTGTAISGITTDYATTTRTIPTMGAYEVPTVPDAPTIGTAAVSGISGTATVSFTQPVSNGGSAITSYTATSSPAGGTGTLSQATSGTITVTGLTNGTAYTFTVKANNLAGASDASAASGLVTPYTVTNAPTSVVATPGNTQVSVAFTAPADNGGSAITSYTVTPYAGETAGTPVTQNANPITVTGLTNSTAYTFTVIANNAAGASAASTASAAVTPDGINNIIEVVNSSLSALTVTPVSDLKLTSGTFTINQAKTVNSLTVETGTALNVTSPLTVQTLTLKAGLDASTFSAKLDAAITANTIRLLKTIDDKKWYFMSFPCDVDVTQITGTGLGALGNDWFIKYYDGAQRGNLGATGTNWKHIGESPVVLDRTTLHAYQGYIFGLKSIDGIPTYERELSFPLNTSILAAETELARDIPVAANNAGDINVTNHGWNLIGQPYLSKFAGANVGINYLTTWNGTAYVGKENNLVSGLNPFEAYFVQVGSSTPIAFAKDGRHLAPASVAIDLSDRVQLTFTSTTGSDNTNLIMDNNQSTAYEIGQDLEKWLTTETTKPQVYTLLSGTNYAYNALPMNSVNNLPVGFYTKTDGSTIISVDGTRAPSLSKLLLTDNGVSPATVTDLLSSNYTFIATAGTNNTRFAITAQRITTDNNLIWNEMGEIGISMVNGKLLMANILPSTTVRVYDALGRLVTNKTATGNSLEIKLNARGIYTVQLQSGTTISTRKVIF